MVKFTEAQFEAAIIELLGEQGPAGSGSLKYKPVGQSG